MKKIPIGVDNFKKIIDGDYYYVDKTLMIKEVLEAGSDASLITRPRRFGKSLNMSMLKYFFEDSHELNGEEDSYGYLFDDLNISKETCIDEQGKYPVIALTFKSCKTNTWERTYSKIIREITNEFKRHKYILKDSNLDQDDIDTFNAIIKGQANIDDYEDSLLLLSKMLKIHHKQPCIILLDEYDVPLQNSHIEDFYDDAIEFVRNLFTATFKQNDYMNFGVITGCLRVSKESIFTGWNNVDVQTVVGDLYLSSFGITVTEKDSLLQEYDMKDEDDLIKQWYDGYNFSGIEIYNPWDLLSYVRNKKMNPDRTPQSYWIGTSSNDILNELLVTKSDAIKKGIKLLIAGEEIEHKISESLTYKNLQSESDNIWSILLFTGYLTGVLYDKDNKVYKLRIPNKSIKQCYIEQIDSYNKSQIKPGIARNLEQYLIKNKAKAINELLNEYLNSTLSYYDDIEAYYHGLLTALCSEFPSYKVESNKEAGTGRADIVLTPIDDDTLPGIILELKYKKTETNLQNIAQKAYDQINDKKYFRTFGLYNKKIVRKYGIAFSKKTCKVANKKSENK